MTLQESVLRLESRTSELEEDRIKMEHTLELKDSLTSTLMAKSMEELHNQLMPNTSFPPQLAPVQTLSSTSMPLMTSSSTNFETLLLPKSTEDKECQSEGDILVQTVSATATADLDKSMTQSWMSEKEKMAQTLEGLKTMVAELKGNIRAKEEALNEIRLIRSKQEKDTPPVPMAGDCSDLQDALAVSG